MYNICMSNLSNVYYVRFLISNVSYRQIFIMSNDQGSRKTEPVWKFGQNKIVQQKEPVFLHYFATPTSLHLEPSNVYIQPLEILNCSEN